MLVMGVMQNKDHYGSQGYKLWKTTLVAETKNTENYILCTVILSAYLVVVDILIISHKIFCEEIFDPNTTGNVANQAFGKMSISDPQVLFIFFD